MTDKELFDQVMDEVLEIRSDDPYVAAEWVPRLQHMLDDVINDFCGAADWDWMYVREDTPIVIPANTGKIAFGSLGLTRVYARQGEQGGLYPVGTTQGRKTDFRPPDRFFSYYDDPAAQSFAGVSAAQIYTIFGHDHVTRSQFLYLYPKLSSAVSYYIRYVPTIPPSNYVANPAGVVGPPAVAPTYFALDYIPVDLHPTFKSGLADLISARADDGKDVRGLSRRYDADLKKAVSSYQQEHPFLQYGDDGAPDERMW